MKYVIMFFALSFGASADQRFETVGGFCHFVTPEGFQTANDDNEVFFANCLNSIRQKANGDGEGSTTVKVIYPGSALLFTEDYTTNGPATGINCNMVDSNGTTYTTNDWNSHYHVNTEDNSITYTLHCRNATQ